MSGTFVRALWGDRYIERWVKARTEIGKYLNFAYQPEPCLYCAFGEENYQTLTDFGLKPILLSKQAIVDFDGRGERYPEGIARDVWGRVNYGYVMWRHKLDCLEHALGDHEAVAWLDWDTMLTAPLPSNFWDQMSKGQPIQTTLNGYRHTICCPWRGVKDQRITGCGGFLYLRDLAILERMKAVYREYPLWIDQDVASYVIDKRSDGWKGIDHYRVAGYEPYCHVSRIGVFQDKPGYCFFTRQGSPSDRNWKPPS
jgi:hypothetical protein